MKIGNFEIGTRTFIIAEIGNNHLGDAQLAKETLAAAAESGVDAVKFQMFNPDLLVSSDEPVLKHVTDNVCATQRERFRKMMLSEKVFIDLAEKTAKLGLTFLTTPFDIHSADFLDPLVPAFKISSGDADNKPLIYHILSKNKPILISTGMSTQDEIDKLVTMLPEDNTLLLHCIGAYPTPDDQACLSLIPFYNEKYKMPIGYSDHTVGLLAPLAAVGMGAVVIEKHFILDDSIPGGDRALSLTPKRMNELVRQIRRVEKMKGTVPRKIQAAEIYGCQKLRRCAYTNRTILQGENITEKDIIWLRPVVENSLHFDIFNEKSHIKAVKTIEKEHPLTIGDITRS